MKKLQNDHTTPEQSKRLLELGVPADSANYYYGKDGKVHYIDGSIPCSLLWADGLVPCWSVGRLIEIYGKCTDLDTVEVFHYDNLADLMVGRITANIVIMDFSKLGD